MQRRYREHMQGGGAGRAGVSQDTCCCKSKLLLAPGLLTGTMRTRREPKHKRVTCLHPIRVKTQSWMARNPRDRILAEKSAAEPVPSHGSLPQAQGPMTHRRACNDAICAPTIRPCEETRAGGTREHLWWNWESLQGVLWVGHGKGRPGCFGGVRY